MIVVAASTAAVNTVPTSTYLLGMENWNKSVVLDAKVEMLMLMLVVRYQKLPEAREKSVLKVVVIHILKVVDCDWSTK